MTPLIPLSWIVAALIALCVTVLTMLLASEFYEWLQDRRDAKQWRLSKPPVPDSRDSIERFHRENGRYDELGRFK